MHQKLNPDLKLILLKSWKNSRCIQDTLLQMRYIEKELLSIFKKPNFIFIFKSSLFI